MVGADHSSQARRLVEEVGMDTIGPWELLIVVADAASAPAAQQSHRSEQPPS